MFTIRSLAPFDIAAILRLNIATPEAPRWPPDVYQTYLGAGDKSARLARRLYVAEQQEHLVGYIAGRLAIDICELESIAVSAPARRCGIGRALLATLIGWARTQSAAQLQLEVRAGNTPAISFYRRAGFHPDGLRPSYYQHPDEDALLMSLPLEPPAEP